MMVRAANTSAVIGDRATVGLRMREFEDYPMPKSVCFSFAGSMQPILAGGVVYVADLQGKVYALKADEGRTLGTADHPGGSLWPGVAGSDAVVFPSRLGDVTAYAVQAGVGPARRITRGTPHLSQSDLACQEPELRPRGSVSAQFS